MNPRVNNKGGSNPTPRTITERPAQLGDFEKYLRSKRTRRGTLLAETTIKTKMRAIKTLSKRVNLWDSEAVENYIDHADLCGGRKEIVAQAYADWCRSRGFEYEKKKYHRERKLPYIPTEKEVDQLIGGFSNSPYCAFLQLIKETAFRPIEASRIRPIDIDVERRIVTLNEPAKQSNPRQFRISLKLINMLNPLLARTDTKDRIWKSKPDNISETIRRHRVKVAKRLGNPRLARITLKTLRHWKATMEYHRTKDILYVKELLGHKNIQNTLVYTHLMEFEENDQFIVKVAKTLDEYTELLELGYNYVSDYDGMKVLRKRK